MSPMPPMPPGMPPAPAPPAEAFFGASATAASVDDQDAGHRSRVLQGGADDLGRTGSPP